MEKKRPIRLGNIYDERFNGASFGGNVWAGGGIAPALKTTSAASQQCVIVEVSNGCKIFRKHK